MSAFPLAGRVAATHAPSAVILSTQDPGLGWTRWWNTPVYSAPTTGADIITSLDRNQKVAVRGEQRDAAGLVWTRILVWNTFDGWIPAHFVAPRPEPPSWGGGSARHPHALGPSPAHPVSATGILDTAAYLRQAPDFGAARLRHLAARTPVIVDSWCLDATGNAWFHGAITTTASTTQYGWVWGNVVTLLRPRSTLAAHRVAAFQGTGMWATYHLLRVSSPAYIVRAAVKQGLSHLYVEVGTSQDGFYGAEGLAALLPVAHRAGLRVIAWVYPLLENLPADVALTVAAALYRAPSGDTPDGVMADVEENMRVADVRAYSQVLRALLGESQPMGVATFPPQHSQGQTYPFSTVARSFDIIAPMDYWHLHARPYTAAESYTYVARSIALIRQAIGNPAQPIEPIGQTFNLWENGIDIPSAAEIRGALRAARDGGTAAISFFEWNHASPDEWAAIAAGSHRQAAAPAMAGRS